jgi:hypothetical protein
MYNFQKLNNRINIPSSQTFRSYLTYLVYLFMVTKAVDINGDPSAWNIIDRNTILRRSLPENRSSIPAGGGDSSLQHHVWTGSGTHLTSYPGRKETATWRQPLASIWYSGLTNIHAIHPQGHQGLCRAVAPILCRLVKSQWFLSMTHLLQSLPIPCDPLWNARHSLETSHDSILYRLRHKGPTSLLLPFRSPSLIVCYALGTTEPLYRSSKLGMTKIIVTEYYLRV